MGNLKVLQLESWMKLGKRINNFLVEIEPRINRNGYYFYQQESWFEYQGEAFTHPGMEMNFVFTLEHLDARELRDREVKILEEFLKHFKSEEFEKILSLHKYKLELKNIRLTAKRMRLQALKHQRKKRKE